MSPPMSLAFKQDISRAKVTNTFTVQGSPINLHNPKAIYFITEIRAGGAFTVAYSSGDGEAHTRNGSGNIQYLHPITGKRMTITGATEVSGYYVEVM